MRSFSIALAVSLLQALPVMKVGSAYAAEEPDRKSIEEPDRKSIYTPPCREGQGEGLLTITFTGDLLLDRGVRREIERHGSIPASPPFADSIPASRPDLSSIATAESRAHSASIPYSLPEEGLESLFSSSIDSLFKQSQVVVANLECPATKIKAPVFKRYIFRAEPEWLPALRRHGITHLCLANNHSIDQGREALMDTRRNIIAAGMTPVGADSTMAAASQPVLLATLYHQNTQQTHPQPLPVGRGVYTLADDNSENKGNYSPPSQGGVGGGSSGSSIRNVWLLASLRLTLENFPYLEDRPCVSQEPMDSLLSRIARLRADDPHAAIIVSLHWGAEHTLKPVPAQRIDAHRIIDAGADALICHHTHTMQTVETYHGKPIYYSIGNFIFDQPKPINSNAAVVKLTVTADSIAAETIPIVIRRCVPYIEGTCP